MRSYSDDLLLIIITRMIKRLLSRGLSCQLCKFSSSQRLADWQYVGRIQRSLKDNNLNDATRHLINSYLDGIVLDRQTFFFMYTKMLEFKADLTYQQLVYKLYRESFSPSLLMSDWMKLLAATADPKTRALLKKDFQALNIEVPKALLQQQNQQTLQKPPQGQTQPPKQPQAEPEQLKAAKAEKMDKGAPGMQFQTFPEEQRHKGAYDASELEINKMQLKQLVELLTRSDVKIVLSNVEVEIDQSAIDQIAEDGSEDIEEEEEEKEGTNPMDEAAMLQENLFMALTSAKNLKIGKIEIIKLSREPAKPQK